MNRQAISCLVAVLLWLPCSSPVWAGAWTVPRNRWYTEYFARYFGSKKEFDARRNTSRRLKSASFRDIRHELKLEYGLADWWNVLASLPYQSSHYQDRNGDLLTTNVGDIYVRTKLRWMTQPIVGSVQFSWKIPNAYNPNESPALGDGQVDFDTRLQLSRAWMFSSPAIRAPRRTTAHSPAPAPPARHSRDAAIRQALALAQEVLMPDVPVASIGSPYARADERTSLPRTESGEELPDQETRDDGVAFVNVEGGFTARNEDPANEIPLVCEAGFTLIRRLMLVGSVESVLSLKRTDEALEDYAKWGLRGILNIWGDGFASVFRNGGPTVNLELGYTDILAGRNTADAFEVFGKVGVFF